MNPFSWIKGRLRCRRGTHERSASGVHHHGDAIYSHCRFCGVTMLRKAKRRWVVVDPARRALARPVEAAAKEAAA